MYNYCLDNIIIQILRLRWLSVNTDLFQTCVLVVEAVNERSAAANVLSMHRDIVPVQEDSHTAVGVGHTGVVEWGHLGQVHCCFVGTDLQEKLNHRLLTIAGSYGVY